MVFNLHLHNQHDLKESEDEGITGSKRAKRQRQAKLSGPIRNVSSKPSAELRTERRVE